MASLPAKIVAQAQMNVNEDVMGSDSDQLQALTCVKCGAALPAEAATGEPVTCGYCGTAFKLPTAHSGGVSISGGSITVGGDIVGGSKRVIVTSEAPSTATIWDEPDTSDDEGVSIEGDGIQVFGDVVGGSVVKIELAAAVTPETGVGPAPKLGWREKIRHWFAN